MRELEPADIAKVAKAATEAVKHPIKPVLEPGFGPVVDGTLLVDQLINSVRRGHLRKDTPISWNYAENDAWGFTGGSFRALEKVPAIEAQSRDIMEAKRDTKFKIPSDYMNQWFKEIYGSENLSMVLEVFGCDNGPNGEIFECQEQFSRFLTASAWSCNSRWALNGVVKVSTSRKYSSGAHL